ncbi:MAG: carbohydrate kinase [Propionibacterium sp.]|nr:carbohydrate kinase [Propionibacterium sp.]
MRFVVLGEALIDLIAGSESSSAVSHWTAHSGGSPLNTATALGRLGKDVRFLGRLSDDAFGRQLSEHLRQHDVDLDIAVRTTDPTTLAVVSLVDGKATYAFHTHGTTNCNWRPGEFPELTANTWLHFGSFSAVIEPSYGPVRDFLASTPARKSFDVNVRPSIIPDRAEYRTKIDDLLQIVGAVRGIGKGSDEDLEWLTDDGSDPLETAASWVRRYGLGMFLITLGPDGAVAIGPDGELARAPGRSVDVVDTVGAGDTFMAGFLSDFDGHNVAASLERGVAASALVCTRQGAQPPTAEELAAILS